VRAGGKGRAEAGGGGAPSTVPWPTPRLLLHSYVLQTYAKPDDLVFVSGAGSRLTDAAGKTYLDFAAGIAVNALGHSDPRWAAAVTTQAHALCHVSNLYHTAPAARLAKRLVESSFGDRAFFCNSGAEANEAAIKFARKAARVRAEVDPYDAGAAAPSGLLSFDNCFHGRTLGALSLTYKSQYKTPFAPLVPGCVSVPYLDLEAAKAELAKGHTAAVFVEPLQGEGGVHPATRAFLQGLRSACDASGALLVFDEVQVGLGRTGTLWAHEHFGVTPDIMTLAKPLAGGLPIGAAIMTQAVADAMAPGDHGSTFAGNPLVCAAAEAVFDIVADPAFLKAVVARGDQLRASLKAATAGVSCVKEVRGLGLITGVQLDRPAGPVVAACRSSGLLVLTAGAGDVVRIVPPLTVSEGEVEEGVATLAAALRAL